MFMAAKKIPLRSEIAETDKWDLSALYPNEASWEEDLKAFQEMIPVIDTFKGTLADSPEKLKLCLDFMVELEMKGERLAYYAHLRVSEDEGSSDAQGRFSRYMGAASRANAAASYQTPEIQAIPEETLKEFIASPILAEHRISLEKLRRFKPHVLSEAEEKLLALQAEANQTADKAFSALTNVDMEFGTIETSEGEIPLTQSTFSLLMIDPDRVVREKAYRQFYQGFEQHKNTLASLYAGSIHLDVYKSRVRKYPSARAKALFPDKVPEEVYDNLLSSVGANLPKLHRYYDLRRRILGLEKLAHWDVYTPLVPDIKVHHSYEEAVEVIDAALEPMGDEYRKVLREGLLGRWVDRYENKGKRSGAFSAGSYHGEPYILMNYKPEVLRNLFTLAHEGGHSMHSWYSVRSNSFQNYDYTIFEAEVASTFNEQLVAKYLMDRADSDAMKAYLLGKQVDDIIATVFRQTMFAEFEHLCHKHVEEGAPLTVDSFRSIYRGLLNKYFGDAVELPPEAELEGLRIPHFYRAFYVYKYATGLSAAVTLAEKVLVEGPEARDAYLAFLKSGGSRYPLESLALAGVDMSRPEPVNKALAKFDTMVSELEKLLL
jgi:oligoendopeptidase F